VKKYLLFFGVLFMGLSGFAQSEQSEYLEAKRLFKNHQYLSSKAAFSALSESEVFGKHATLYAAISAYKIGDYSSSKDILRQLLVQFPTWDQKSEVIYWLAMSNFETQDYGRALAEVSELTDVTGNSEVEEQMIQKYLSPLDLSELEELQSDYPDNQYVAEYLVRKLVGVPYQERDFDRINRLVAKWGFKLHELDVVELPIVKKEVYNIAVVLPFLFESLENTALISQNSLVMDMYQGMLLAVEDLAAAGRPVQLFPYDTKRRAQNTEEILQTEGFENNDVIIGPLYPQPNAIVRAYAEENQVNHWNPLSANEEVIGNSSFSFLVKPTYSTQGSQLGEYAVKSRPNDYAMIFYEESEKDSLFAAAFKERLEQDSIEVVRFQPINKLNSHAWLDTLSAQYDSYLTREEADSIQLLPGRFVRERRVRKGELRKIEKDTSYYMPVSYDEDENAVVYYEKLFYMAPDSIGTILAATRSNLFANNLISAVETRGDSINLFGYGEWLEFTMLSYNQLDRLGVGLSEPDFMDRDGLFYDDLTQKFVNRYKTKPSMNHFRGYETVYFLGKMLHTYGKYFQRGLRGGEYWKGVVLEGYKYGATNDNQVVPVVKFNNAKLEVVNRDLYEDRKK